MDDIGKKIFNRRKELGLTLEEVGKEVGVGKSTVQRWENGLIQNMRRDKIASLARVLHMDPIEFVPGGSQLDTLKRVEVQTPKKRLFAMDSMPVKAEVSNFGIKVPEVKEVMIDDDLKAILKIWKISTPRAKKAAIEMLKTLADEKEGKL